MSSIIGRAPVPELNSFQEELNQVEAEFIRRIKLASIAYGEGLVRLNDHHKNTVAELWKDLIKEKALICAKYEEGVTDETKKD